MDEMEQIVFSLITNSGEARSYAFEALDEAMSGKYEEAVDLIKKSNIAISNAHKMQTSLIQNEAVGNKTEVSLLLVHAQDHLMTSILARDLIEKMIHMQSTIVKLEKKIISNKI
ncbi:PTS lactose/cellobiose transporter subunit IIA [Clostridium sp. AL.422]|uniref:PTS lactose/cellobiose transporter subunit IIA n=1 Tax=Clostridium TaxID=1485 RepID=UPI00293DD652|nr:MULTISPECIES: PTS lactose/cellobiose transporter subunit IIA [unclassified Clostridium]MDV4150850.1 PTS lactose/cellobiose transporter subunit IIA [Clostridium sp. AL.422]